MCAVTFILRAVLGFVLSGAVIWTSIIATVSVLLDGGIL